MQAVHEQPLEAGTARSSNDISIIERGRVQAQSSAVLIRLFQPRQQCYIMQARVAPV